MKFLNHSKVKFVCVCVTPPFLYVSKALISTWPLIGQYPKFKRHHTANPCANPYAPIGEHQIACGDWLVCQTTSVCNNPFMCMAQILAHAFHAYVCADGTRTAILNWAPFRRWTPGRVRLPTEPAFCAFGNTLCGRSHGDQRKTASTHAVSLLRMNVWL